MSTMLTYTEGSTFLQKEVYTTENSPHGGGRRKFVLCFFYGHES